MWGKHWTHQTDNTSIDRPDSQQTKRHGHPGGDRSDEAIFAAANSILANQVEDKLIGQLTQDARSRGFWLRFSQISWKDCPKMQALKSHKILIGKLLYTFFIGISLLLLSLSLKPQLIYRNQPLQCKDRVCISISLQRSNFKKKLNIRVAKFLTRPFQMVSSSSLRREKCLLHSQS